MDVLRGKLNDNGIFSTTLKLHPSLNFSGVVLDFETTDYDPAKGEIVAAGFLFGNRALILVRTYLISREEFYNELKGVIEELNKQYGAFYAYNAPFEGKWLRTHLGVKLLVKEIMEPSKGVVEKLRTLKGRYKLPKLRELLHPRFFHYFGLKDWDIDSSEVGKLWKKHLEEKNTEPLKWIAWHNLLDLLSELELLAVWNPLIGLLNENGTLLGLLNDNRCEVCEREAPVEELALMTYPERKKDGGFRFKEKRVCTRCLKKLWGEKGDGEL